MEIVLIGLSHKTASIEIREQFYLQTIERELLLSQLKNDPMVAEAFVLSTCNRTEIYALMINESPEVLFDVFRQIKKDIHLDNLRQHFYIKKNEEVIRHFLGVTCGLDSLVVGEKQILGQVKHAADLARQMGTLSQVFNILINLALSVGKLAQTKTQIGCGGSSISWAAVTMVQDMLGDLQEKSILIVGAGKMSQLTAGQLLRRSVKDVFVMNRTYDKALELAHKIRGVAVTFLDLKKILAQVDACICSAGAAYFLIDSEDVKEVMKLRQGRPLLFIDISTPRNINPNVAKIPNVQLMFIDDLKKVIDINLQSRSKAIILVNQLIENKVDYFYKKINKGRYITESVYV